MRQCPLTLADLDGRVALCSAKENADQSLILIACCGPDVVDTVKRKEHHSMEGIVSGVNIASARVVRVVAIRELSLLVVIKGGGVSLGHGLCGRLFWRKKLQQAMSRRRDPEVRPV